MSDKELLEMAARAAGLHVVRSRLDEAYADLIVDNHEEMYPEREFSPSIGWNPLTDDGDALRLAVKLGIPIEVDYGVKEAIVRGRFGLPLEGDPYAAARRAIVRAAASIGKEMK